MLVLAWLATGIGSLWMVKEAVAAKAWRQAVSWRTLSVIVFMGMVFLDAVRVYADRGGDLLHLGIWLDHYECRVRSGYLTAVERLGRRWGSSTTRATRSSCLPRGSRGNGGTEQSRQSWAAAITPGMRSGTSSTSIFPADPARKAGAAVVD